MPSRIPKEKLRPEIKLLGANIRKMRVKKGLTQEKLAEGASIETRTLQKIEAGDINILTTTLKRIKKPLGCDWTDLLD